MESHERRCSWGQRLVHLDQPAIAIGRVAGDTEVAAEVDHRTGDAGVEQLLDHQVGGETLADASRIERCSGESSKGRHSGPRVGAQLHGRCA